MRRLPHVWNARTPRRLGRRTHRHPSAARRVNSAPLVLYHWQDKKPLSHQGLTGIGIRITSFRRRPEPRGGA